VGQAACVSVSVEVCFTIIFVYVISLSLYLRQPLEEDMKKSKAEYINSELFENKSEIIQNFLEMCQFVLKCMALLPSAAERDQADNSTQSYRKHPFHWQAPSLSSSAK